MTVSESYISNSSTSFQREENYLIMISFGLLIIAAIAFITAMILSVI